MRPLLCLLLLLCSCALASAQYADRELKGWTLHVHPGVDENDLAKALPLLEAQLDEIVRVVPPKAVAALRQVPLWISPEYSQTPPRAEYHPNASWLKEHGRNADMAKGVEFTNVRIFEAECRRMPNFALHELAHAYHDRVLGYDQGDIRAAFAAATQAGKYDRVERQDAAGRKRLDRAYAMTNAKEYFAECSEAFFSRNDFYPFNREELKQHDPEMCTLLARLWGVAEAE